MFWSNGTTSYTHMASNIHFQISCKLQNYFYTPFIIHIYPCAEIPWAGVSSV